MTWTKRFSIHVASFKEGKGVLPFLQKLATPYKFKCTADIRFTLNCIAFGDVHQSQERHTFNSNRPFKNTSTRILFTTKFAKIESFHLYQSIFCNNEIRRGRWFQCLATCSKHTGKKDPLKVYRSAIFFSRGFKTIYGYYNRRSSKVCVFCTCYLIIVSDR